MKTTLILLTLCLASARAVTFEAWVASYGLTGDSAQESADPDRDGLSNLVEYALHGLVPTTVNNPTITKYGYAPANSDGSYGEAEALPPVGAPRSWHHALVYQPRADAEGLSIIPQLNHDCPATGTGGNLQYWLGAGGRDDALIMVYSRVDGKLQAMSRARGHLQRRAFFRLRIVRDGGLTAPETEGACVPFLGLTAGRVQLVPRVVGTSTSGSVTDRDVTYTQVTDPLVVHDIRWPWTAGGGVGAGDVSRSFSPAGVVTLGGSSDLWSYAADGQVTITLTTPVRSYSQAVNTYSIPGRVTRTFSSSAAGSLRASIASAVATRTANQSTNFSVASLYTSMDAVTPSYTRNTLCMLYSADTTPVAAWNSRGAAQRGPTLISPRHFICAQHWSIAAGDVVHFVAANNAVTVRTVTAVVWLAQASDICVGILDSDVPAGINFCRVLPNDYAVRLPTLGIFAVPVWFINQDKEASLHGWEGYGSYANFGMPNTLFYRAPRSGDSGSPFFTFVGTTPVLLGCIIGGGQGGAQASNPVLWRTEINAAMTSLGGGYQLTDVDLSGFNSY